MMSGQTFTDCSAAIDETTEKRWVRNQMRNKSLDAVKAIAACLVVCIHVSFPGQAGQLVKVLARCAVPFFFMVSGYFCYYQNCNASKRILSKILHIMKLFAVSVVFYFIWECFMKAWNGERVWTWIKGTCEYRASEGIFRVQQYFSGKSTFMVSSCINLLLSACSPD